MHVENNMHLENVALNVFIFTLGLMLSNNHITFKKFRDLHF
jgi:hypothetical protein